MKSNMKEELFKKYLPWTIRVLVFIIFTVSGIAKLFPVWAFEKQLVDLGITSWQLAPYFARLIIASELAIGFLILQPHFLKRIVIPVTIFMLAAFCVHLTIQMVKYGAMSGNCGCFGQLIPMTPLEAFIKNVVTIGLLVYLFFTVSEKEKGKNRFIYLLLAYVVAALILFMLFPFCPYKEAAPVTNQITVSDTTAQNVSTYDSSQTADINKVNSDEAVAGQTTPQNKAVPPVISGPNFVQSQFSRYTTFGNQTIDPDDGKKLFCFFVPGCDECRVVARQLDSLAKKADIPPVYVFFLNEETDKIPEFFQVSRSRYPYTILEVPAFWSMMGTYANTPGVFYMWNGNTIRFYEGDGANRFSPADLLNALGR